uniref:NADH-ubiquinone oxidoreductase chain 4L n=1 Tax=Sceloporus grammicus TaxID=36306 RepID=Q36944_SCEGA|nr:presumptive protein 4L [Sceloporus grammicus]AAA67405.1 presumptive protein 4L [Sceloporus grammicus]
MLPVHFMLNSTFILSIMGLSMHRMHLMSALLCIEGMMLALFIIISTFFSTNNLQTMAPAPIMLLALSACEASIGLALMVATSRTHGNDNLKNLNLLQC